MCDTFVALGSATRDDSVIFGKNSDRPYEEKQVVSYIPSQEYSDDIVKCTYISIPQIEKTNAVLLSKPDWMWGAEMGANEHGVVIGNEAVWTKEPLGKPSLLGMDLLRLSLERSSNASDAVAIICDLLEEYGQGGACAEGDSSFAYHNSFLIADKTKAWVLETAGEWWIAEKTNDGYRNISNGLSIHKEYDLIKEGLIDYATDQGYCEDKDHFDFAKQFSMGGYNLPSKSTREGYGRELLRKNYRKMTPKKMMDILRNHKTGICMHGGFRTTGSQVSKITDPEQIHWMTASPHPCISMFKPFTFSNEMRAYTIDIWNERERFNENPEKIFLKELSSLEEYLLEDQKMDLQEIILKELSIIS